MKILTVSTMFPNKAQPSFGIFVLQRLKALSKLSELKVVAPVPYCPIVGILKKYAYRAKVPQGDTIDGLEITYQRFFSIPMILKPLDAVFLFVSLFFFCRRVQREFDFDIIDAHLAYPDGFAAVLLGKLLGKPVTITLRGHDIFALPAHPVRKKQVIYALKEARHIFSVSQGLKDGAVGLGIDAGKITVVPNGVDSEKFYRVPMSEARQKLDLPQDKKIILSVGHLVVRKGFHHLIKALAELQKNGEKDFLLVIVGGPGIEGDFSACLRGLIAESNLSAQVKLVGAQPYERLYLWYNAADVFCLVSEHEGHPNAMIEAMACGRPVIVNKSWCDPTMLNCREGGVLVDPENYKELADAIKTSLDRDWDFGEIITAVQKRDWKHAAERIYLKDKKIVGGTVCI